MPGVVETRDILGEANALIDAATAIITNSKSSAEERAKVPAMLEDAKGMKAQLLQLQELEGLANDFKAGARQAAAQNPAQPGTPGTGGFKTMGEFFKAVHRLGANRGRDERLKGFNDPDEKAYDSEHKDMSEQTGPAGGILVPPEYQATLMSVAAENSIVRPRATKVPMRRRQVNIPVLDQTKELGAGIPTWFGGLRAYWTEEAGLKTPSDATFRELTLTAWKLIMFTRSSDELLDDSAISLQAFLSGNMGFPGAIAWNEDYAFMNGDGVGKPLGYLKSPACLTGARAGGSNIDYVDLTGMMKKFLPTGQGTWVISQSAMAELLELNGPSGNPSYIWGSAVSGAPNTLLGYPVIWSEKSPILGALGDVALVDLRYYLIGDRQTTTVESTRFEKWENDQTSWRAVHRVDGRPWLSEPLTYQDQSTQVSPFVALAA